MTDFEEGEQFFIDYGKRSIAEQFLHNGFISDDQYNQLPLNVNQVLLELAIDFSLCLPFEGKRLLWFLAEFLGF